jgi:4-carboxymuconolactone decarboxylase
MARVQFLEKTGLPSGHQHIYDEIAVSHGGVQRNFKAFLNSPMATSKMAILGGYVRCETPPRVKALAVLAATREIDGDYLWSVNQRQAKAAGLNEEIVTAIRERRAPSVLAPKDAVIVQFTQELLRQHRISDATFKAVQQRLGEAGVVDLLMLIGYYHSLSHTLSALEVMSEAGSVLTN